jgi:hypothetical protein
MDDNLLYINPCYSNPEKLIEAEDRAIFLA